jgi:hypothetical protein
MVSRYLWWLPGSLTLSILAVIPVALLDKRYVLYAEAVSSRIDAIRQRIDAFLAARHCLCESPYCWSASAAHATEALRTSQPHGCATLGESIDGLGPQALDCRFAQCDTTRGSQTPTSSLLPRCRCYDATVTTCLNRDCCNNASLLTRQTLDIAGAL